MAENLTLARPYAEAAFALAKADGTLPAWSQALQRLATMSSRPELAECIGNPRIGGDQVAALCLDVAGTELSHTQQNFVRVLIDNQRLSVLPEVADIFGELRNTHEGTRDAAITSAFPLADDVLAGLTSALERKFGGRIKTSVEIDPSLIGGVRIAVGDEVIDASVSGKLAAMATALKN